MNRPGGTGGHRATSSASPRRAGDAVRQYRTAQARENDIDGFAVGERRLIHKRSPV